MLNTNTSLHLWQSQAEAIKGWVQRLLNKWRLGRTTKQWDLTQTDLTQMDLTQMDLTQMALTQMDLTQMDLTQTALTQMGLTQMALTQMALTQTAWAGLLTTSVSEQKLRHLCMKYNDTIHSPAQGPYLLRSVLPIPHGARK